jgi:HD-GYP domain-containing protein (c-di-GMP phosphodiesterase class II)
MTLSPDALSATPAEVVPGFYELPWMFLAQLDAIRCETYIKNGRRATLYAKPGYSPAALRARAAEGAVFLIRTGDMVDIRRDLASVLDRALGDPSISPISRSKAAYAIATAITVPALAGPRPSTDDLAVVRETVNTFTRILLKAPEKLWNICSVLTDEPKAHIHAVNTAVLTLVMANEFGIHEEAALREVGLGAFLHDLGLLRLPRRLLHHEAETEPDMELLRQHPAKGLEMVREHGAHVPAYARYVAEHHERFDGTGYPNGLAGEQISLPGRLIAIISAFEAGTQAREHGPTPTPFEVLVTMSRDAGAFDPDILRRFITVLGGRNLLAKRSR